MTPKIKRFDFSQHEVGESTEGMSSSAREAMVSDGAIIIENALTEAEIDAIVGDMRPYIETTPHGLHGLEHSRRVGALVARSPASHKAIAHPAVLDICEAILGEQLIKGKLVMRTQTPRGQGKYPWRLTLTQIIDVGPGQEQQGVHRGNGLWVHDLAGCGFDPQIETMWALSDFTEENGATHVIPGSHLWEDVFSSDKEKGTTTWFGPPPQETVRATMPKGSVLIWTGWTVHGAGANQSNERRIGMNIDYSVAFLEQEENQFLACPPEIARNLSPEMQKLIGYFQPGGALNYFADCLPPEVSLREDYDVMRPGAHGLKVD